MSKNSLLSNSPLVRWLLDVRDKKRGDKQLRVVVCLLKNVRQDDHQQRLSRNASIQHMMSRCKQVMSFEIIQVTAAATGSHRLKVTEV
jgi:hypothetical protein